MFSTHTMRNHSLQNRRKFFTTGQVANYCGVHFRTVIRWIEKGYIAAHTLPGRGDNRITEEELIRFLQENEMPIPDDLKQTASRVLIVDDENDMARAIERVLKRKGYNTAIANGGFQTGAMLYSFKPDLITLDLKMPGMDGYRLMEFIRSEENCQDVKILVISGLSRGDLLSACIEGADSCLEKPFRNHDLLEEVRCLIGEPN
ncbi:response regulator [Algicola sagamiensis]|uniref:response regulator n=1 Tax=Algicola sagamiensis TaxID=163869 RepID=UPI00035C75E2|nr:response regulator [Algicola sagamiensis]